MADDTSTYVRKTLRITPEKLDSARRLLGTKTDAETVDAALDLVAFRHEVIGGVRRLAGTGIARDLFDREPPGPLDG